MPKSEDGFKAIDMMATATQDQPQEVSEEKKYPKIIRMKRLYAFIDDLNRTRTWKPGDVIKDEGEVKLLVDREPDPDHRPFDVVEE